MVLKCVSCGVGSIFGSNFVPKIFSIIWSNYGLKFWPLYRAPGAIIDVCVETAPTSVDLPP